MTTFPRLFCVGMTAASVAIAGCGMRPTAAPPQMSAMTEPLRATLSGAAEVPANASAGTGDLEASLDKSNNVLRWKLVYSGLSGPVTMAHFHGPALPGANAGVVVPLPSTTSPAEGMATLTAPQAAELLAGRWYINVHTAMHPGGEIRGQVLVR